MESKLDKLENVPIVKIEKFDETLDQDRVQKRDALDGSNVETDTLVQVRKHKRPRFDPFEFKLDDDAPKTKVDTPYGSSRWILLMTRISMAIRCSGTEQWYTEKTEDMADFNEKVAPEQAEREEERMRHERQFQQAVDGIIHDSRGAFSREESQFTSSLPTLSIGISVFGPVITRIYGKVHDLVVCVAFYQEMDTNFITLWAPMGPHEHFSRTVDIDSFAKFLKEYFDKTPITIVLDATDGDDTD